MPGPSTPARRLLGLAAGVAATALTLAGCSADPTAEPAAGTLSLVASTNVWASVASAVTAGVDGVTVTSVITDPAADPHSYESTPRDAATLSDAQVVLYNGGGYDPFVSDVLAAEAPDVPTVEAFAVHQQLSGATSDEGVNEHVWYDLPTVSAVAARVAEQLGALDPADAARYTANAEAFATGAQAVTARAQAIGAARGGTEVAQTEPIAAYLIEAAGLVDGTPEEFLEAVEEETDPPAAAVAATRDLLSSGTARALVYNTQAESPVTEQVRGDAQAAGVPVVEVTETLPADQDGYLAWMTAQVEDLAQSLGVA